MNLPYPKNVGKLRKMTKIGGGHRLITIEDEIVCPQGKRPYRKLIYLQKLRHEADNRIDYRFTYYMSGTKGRMIDRWVFGQYSLMIPAKELKTLLEEARKRGWEGF